MVPQHFLGKEKAGGSSPPVGSIPGWLFNLAHQFQLALLAG